MSGNPLSADTARQFAQTYLREAGKAATDAQLADLSDLVLRAIRVDPESRDILAIGDDGTFAPADFNAVMGGWTTRLPCQPATTGASTAPARPDPGDLYHGRNDTFARLGRGLAAQRAAEDDRRAQDVIRQGNPWKSGRINRTAQAIITKSNPELAARWKAEAGVHEAKYSWK